MAHSARVAKLREVEDRLNNLMRANQVRNVLWQHWPAQSLIAAAVLGAGASACWALSAQSAPSSVMFSHYGVHAQAPSCLLANPHQGRHAID